VVKTIAFDRLGSGGDRPLWIRSCLYFYHSPIITN